MSPSLDSRIKAMGSTSLDGQILAAFTLLATHLIKTNFYVRKKAAVSFRLDPSFMSLTEWPAHPYGLFFVVGTTFQGFHIRFEDISRKITNY